RNGRRVVVAGGAGGGFVEPGQTARTLVSAGQADMVAPESRRRDRDLVSDRPGRGFSAAGSSRRHALEPPHDYHKLEKHNFTAALAQTLGAVLGRGQYERLGLVTPKRRLGGVHTLLSPAAKKLVSHQIAKDLTTATPASLWRALEKVLPAPILA